MLIISFFNSKYFDTHIHFTTLFENSLPIVNLAVYLFFWLILMWALFHNTPNISLLVTMSEAWVLLH